MVTYTVLTLLQAQAVAAAVEIQAEVEDISALLLKVFLTPFFQR